uniref:FBD domain-containing protein n=1 Tax=Leersia perrieri TaxID=77586 RepID=A0A0D9X7Z5_9ORYZ
MVLDELPSSTRLETMVLSLSNACLRLPVAATFHSLTDLSLMNIRLEKNSSRHLNHLLSSACCPLDEVVDRLHVESNELLELLLCCIGKHTILLELKTPCLRVLDMRYVYAKRLSITAPRLEKFTFYNTTVASRINIEDMPCARDLIIDLRSILRPGYGERLNQASFQGYRERSINTYQNQRDHHIISLEYLQEIKIISYYMRDYEARLIKLLHASAPPLKKMRVAVKPTITMRSQILGMHPKIICEEFLHSIALDKEGKWAFCNHDAQMQDFISFEWTPIEK